MSELSNKLKEDIDHCQNDLIRIDITNDQLNKLKPDFMYSQLLKEALINIDILIKMVFFIRVLHQQIENLYLSQEHNSIVVYRGQGMTNNQFEK